MIAPKVCGIWVACAQQLCCRRVHCNLDHGFVRPSGVLLLSKLMFVGCCTCMNASMDVCECRTDRCWVGGCDEPQAGYQPDCFDTFTFVSARGIMCGSAQMQGLTNPATGGLSPFVSAQVADLSTEANRGYGMTSYAVTRTLFACAAFGIGYYILTLELIGSSVRQYWCM